MGRRQRLVASVPVPSSVAHHRLSPSHRLLVPRQAAGKAPDRVSGSRVGRDSATPRSTNHLAQRPFKDPDLEFHREVAR
jgi:hypothetical protein